MARFLIWSDLHCEFRPGEVPQVPASAFDVDAVLIAGDIHTAGRHMDMLLLIWDQIRKPIIYVRGNHEFYGTIIPDLIAREAAKLELFRRAGAEIHLLDGGSVLLGDTRVIGATLWTDLDLFPGAFRQSCDAVKATMSDFGKIRTDRFRNLSIEDWRAMHARDLDYLLTELTTPFAGPTLVMTHHLPIRQMIGQRYQERSLAAQLPNAGFASDLWERIRSLPIDTWIAGHSHHHQDFDLRTERGAIRFLANPLGYPKEQTGFIPDLVIETGAPTMWFDS